MKIQHLLSLLFAFTFSILLAGGGGGAKEAKPLAKGDYSKLSRNLQKGLEEYHKNEDKLFKYKKSEKKSDQRRVEKYEKKLEKITKKLKAIVEKEMVPYDKEMESLKNKEMKLLDMIDDANGSASKVAALEKKQEAIQKEMSELEDKIRWITKATDKIIYSH